MARYTRVTHHERRDTVKTINVRELRALIPVLKQELATEHEFLLVSNGEPIARIIPVSAQNAVRPRLQSLKAFRDSMPMAKTAIEVLIREERDRR